MNDVHFQFIECIFFGLEIMKSMRARKEGQIVAVSSMQGRLAIPYRSSYAASKHALQAFFDTARAEVAQDNISICVVSPGYIKTNLSLNAITGSGAAYGRMDKTTASGMEPIDAASEIYHAIVRKDEEIVLAPLLHKIVILLRAFCPAAFFYVMQSRAKSEKKRT